MGTVHELTESQMLELLARNNFARLGCHAEDMTYVVPITYVLDGTALVGHTAEGLKVRMMRKNPRVCVQVDEVENVARWRSVICWGRFEELEGIDAAMAMGKLIDAMSPHFDELPVSNRSPRDVTPDPVRSAPPLVYRIVLEKMTGRAEG